MPLTQTAYEHIAIDGSNVPFIKSTTMKVVELVQEHIAHGWSAEELHFQHPHLSLGQIHSALAYYWDHKDELDRDMTYRRERVKEMRRAAPISPLVARIKAQS